MTRIKGFSKLSKQAKIEWVINNYFDDPEKALELLKSYWHADSKAQKLHDEFIENTITNFYLPFGVAPNFLINGKDYCIPLATEESSVVAAAAKAANFWLDKGGFTSTIISTTKIGHVHFNWYGENIEVLKSFFDSVKENLITSTDTITKNMRQRGGGIVSLELVDKTAELPNYFQLEAKFETCDSMGANFINSVLEQFAQTFKEELFNSDHLSDKDKDLEIVMCILSNYNPECLVRAEVNCTLEDLEKEYGENAISFAHKFCRAVEIAEVEPYRATTHNKGIMNGIDSVVVATGNDFRAIEACGHTYAARDGGYRSLTDIETHDGIFRYSLKVWICDLFWNFISWVLPCYVHNKADYIHMFKQ